MKKSKIIVLIVLVILLIASIALVFWYNEQKQYRPGEAVENSDMPALKAEYSVPPILWAEYLYGDNLTDFEKEKMPYVLLEFTHDYFFDNIELLGTQFPEGMFISDSFESVTNLDNIKGNKVIMFTNLEDEYVMNQLDEYMFLKSEAENIGAYGLYFVNYKEDESKEFFKTVSDGYVLVNKNKDINTFLNRINKNIILFLDENNIIQAAMDYASVTNLSQMAMYAFTGDIKIKDYVEAYLQALNSPEETTKIFLDGSTDTKSYGTIYELNSDNNFLFFEIKGIDGYHMKSVELINSNLMKAVYYNEATDKSMNVEQKYGGHTFSGEEKYTYFNQFSKNTTFYNVYGSSKEEIYAFIIIKNNISVFLESETPMTTSDIEKIIDDTF